MKLSPMSMLFFVFGGAVIGAGLGLFLGGKETMAIMGLGMLLTGVLEVWWRET